MFFCIFFLANLFVFDSYSYELVEERLRVAPECTGGVSYCVVESGFLSSMLSDFLALHPEVKEEYFDCLTSKSGCGSAAGARAYSVDGMKNSNVMLNSEHSFYLCNDTNESCQFRVITKLSTHDYQSTEHDQVFVLKQKEYVRTSRYLYLNKSYSETGSFKIYASTDVSLSSSSSANDTAMVTIR